MTAVGTTAETTPKLWYSADGHAFRQGRGGSRIDLGPVEPVGPGHVRPVGALTNEGSRFFDCASAECRGKGPRPFPMRHTAKLGSVYWTCTGCDETRESTPCKPEDFPFDPTPAAPETGNLPVTGQEESRERCSICRARAADVAAYYAAPGKTGQLAAWCFGCVADTAGLVAGAGIPVTLLPLDPIPGEAELRAQLDRAQRGDGQVVDHHAEARAAVRRTAPAGRRPGEWR